MRWPRIADVVLLGVIATPAWAEDGAAALPAHALDRAPPAPESDLPLYLAVTRNHTPLPDLLPFVLREGRLHAGPQTLESLGFRRAAAGAGGPVALDAIPGVQVRYDSAAQQVSIDAPLSELSLETTRAGRQTDAPAPVAADSSPGLLLNYDVYASEADGGSQLSAGTELRMFGVGPGVLSNTALLRTGRGDGGAGREDGRRWRRESVRLDTRWDFAFPARAVSVTLGDSLAGFLDWSRPVRLGGIQVGATSVCSPIGSPHRCRRSWARSRCLRPWSSTSTACASTKASCRSDRSR